jgi:hypothetical protein
MNATADAFMAIFGMKPGTCKTCAHALPSACYPMVYCPVKFKPVNEYDHCKAYEERRK